MRSTEPSSEELADGAPQDSEERVDQLESRMDALANVVSRQDEQIEELQAENKELSDELAVVRRQLEQMEKDTSMLGDIREGNSSTRERRMAVIMLTLRNKAVRSGGKATMDAGQCHDALNQEPHRSTVYGLMEDAVRLVESDSVRMVKESRSSSKNTRIVMDESRGPLPSTFEGHDIAGEEVA